MVQRFAETPMRLQDVSNHDMGQAFEELLRKFNDVSPAGEQYTPRDVIELMVNILFDGDSEVLSVPGVVRTVYDPTAGTGGMLSVAEEHLRRFNDRAVLKLFGQELEDETYAICKADMLIRGQDPANIANGDTLVIDKHPQQSFEYMLSNPPYGVEWKPAEAAVRKEHGLGAKGRYAAGLPAIRDGQMLFSLHLLSKMQAFIKDKNGNGKGGSRIAVVHNGSPLFTGDAGGGESEIRRYILENDYLDCIVAMPTDLFYNTNITTYLWFMSNRKPPERKGKVLLLDASGMAVLLKKNLGKKRREFTADCMARITRAYHEHTALDWTEPKANGDTSPARKLKVKLLPTSHFFYRKLTIERPLRQRFDITADTLAALQADAVYAKLPAAQASALLASVQALLEKSSKPKALPPSYASAALFRAALNKTSQRAPINELLKAKTLELARKACGTRDPSAQPTTNEKGDVLLDAELRDAEYVPYGDDVRAYFAKEVLPHWPDAWINEAVLDGKDGKLGMVGTEINFNREFYQYTPPRSRQALIALLREYRQSTISSAVTQGLNPAAPRKPSGIAWLGDVPKHWDIKKLKFVATVAPSNIDKLSVEGETPVKLCNYVDVYKNDKITSAIEFMPATASPEQIARFKLKVGDVVVTKDSESPWDIAVPTVIAEEIDGLVCGYHLAKITPVNAVGEYLAWAFRAKEINTQFALASNGITRYGLGVSGLSDGNFPVPPLA